MPSRIPWKALIDDLVMSVIHFLAESVIASGADPLLVIVEIPEIECLPG